MADIHNTTTDNITVAATDAISPMNGAADGADMMVRVADDDVPNWYVIRCAYGREKVAYEYLLEKGIRAFYPTVKASKSVKGKDTVVDVSRLPNLFFAYGTFDAIKQYVYDNIHDETKYMRFYYNLHHDGNREPLIVPDRQMRSLMLICDSAAEDIRVEAFAEPKFLKGEHVIVKEGPFAGVEGIVARYRGQQRVGIAIEGLLTIATAYVPTSFLERLQA